MKIVNMLTWLICSSLGHKWHQMDKSLQEKPNYKCKRCSKFMKDKGFKHTIEILLPKQFTDS